MSILVPVDFSDVTELVIERAMHLSQALSQQLVLLHVYWPAMDKIDYTTAPDFGPGAAGVMGYLPPLPETAVDEESGDQLRERLEVLKKKIAEKGVTVTCKLVEGVADSQIVKQANEQDADIIVIGSHGRGAVYDLLVGSTTSYVLRKSRRAVLVVPAGCRSVGKKEVGHEDAACLS